jgi:hypothetical protein
LHQNRQLERIRQIKNFENKFTKNSINKVFLSKQKFKISENSKKESLKIPLLFCNFIIRNKKNDYPLKGNTYTTFIFYCLLAFFSLSIHAQGGWEKTYGGGGNEAVGDMLPTADGGFLLLSSSSSFGTEEDVYMVKVDVDGNTQWNAVHGDSLWEEYGRALQTHPQGFAFAGTQIKDGIAHIFIGLTDIQGELEWMRMSEVDSVYGWSLALTPDGGFLVAGNIQVPETDPVSGPYLGSDVFLVKFDSLGNEEWGKSYGGPKVDAGRAIVPTDDGHYLIGGYTRSYGNGNFDYYLIKVDQDGNELWSTTLGSPAAELAHGLIRTADGNFVIVGRKNDGGANLQDIYLVKTNAAGQELWSTAIPLAGIQAGNSVREMADGRLLVSGETRDSPNDDRDVILARLEANGNLQFVHTYGGWLGDAANVVAPLANKGAALAGFTHSFGAGNADNYLIRTDSLGVAFSNRITGRVFVDEDLDCEWDSTEQAVPHWVIEAEGYPNYLASTDSAGIYSVLVDTGNFIIQLATTHPNWLPCTWEYSVAFAGKNNMIHADFPLQPLYDCPGMEVDVSAPFLRRCYPSQYTVNYCNTGSQTATNAQVEVTFDPYMEVLSSSIPWNSQSGQTFTFDLGNVDAFECGAFQVEVLLDCDSTVTGQTHCVEAHILPDTFCLPGNPLWDGASIDLDANCEGDSVVFNIRNTGAGMAQPLSFIIIEDHIMFMQGPFWLDTLQDTTITLYPEGKTLRLEAEQSPGHPGSSEPSIVVEGCGSDPFSTGYVVQLPMDDGDPFVDIDCQESIASYDPNDKRGFPEGYGEEHFIRPNTELEYIIRFQNTGTDTAFLVVIRDTLSPWLDAASIRPGASSHPYQFEVYNSGVIKFTFPDIMLPDSTTNELASIGFIKYRIKQQADNPVGTEISNTAAIYFDFNAPIITNQTIHRIGENFIEVDTLINLNTNAKEPTAEVRVYPNPFSDKAHFEVDGIIAQQGVFKLFDQQGRQVREQIVETNPFIFSKNDLPAGIYFFQLVFENEVRIGGKICISGRT